MTDVPIPRILSSIDTEANILFIGHGRVTNYLTTTYLSHHKNLYAICRTNRFIHNKKHEKQIHWIQADVNILNSLNILKTHVFHYIIYATSPDSYTEDAYQLVYLHGLLNVVQLIKQYQQNPKVVFISSTSVYGHNTGEWVDEASTTLSSSFSGRIIQEAENLLLHHLPFANILRFGGIYGTNPSSLIKQIKDKTIRIHIHTKQYTNRIHIHDSANMIYTLLVQSDTSYSVNTNDNIFLGVDCLPENKKQVIEWIAKKIQVQLPSTCYVQKEIKNKRSGNKRCSNKKILSLGFQFSYPTYQEGYLDLIQKV